MISAGARIIFRIDAERRLVSPIVQDLDASGAEALL
jgi:hypothetical protein